MEMQRYLSDQEAREKGPQSFFVKDLSFREVAVKGEPFLQPAPEDGEGFVYQTNPAPGLFISIGDWKPYVPMGRSYQISQLFMELYFVESGEITLIQNGKNALRIPEGVNVYLNRPSKGRLVYGAGAAIKYVSIVLFEDFIREHIESAFSADGLDFAETFNWKPYNYNTPEVTMLFAQLRQRLLSFEKSRLYYISKVGELLSVIMSNFLREKERLEAARDFVAPNDLKSLERVRAAIDGSAVNPPDMAQLCRLAAMGKTKLRESFRAAYHVTLGGYIREAKMKHALMLLANQEQSVQAVAVRLGFASASKFSLAFKRIYGMSPKEYRKSIGG